MVKAAAGQTVYVYRQKHLAKHSVTKQDNKLKKKGTARLEVIENEFFHCSAH